MAVPNKTIYVSDGDLTLYQRAQELAGGNLSAAIAKALKRYVDAEEGLREGFDEIIVRVGVGSGRKVRFTGILVGEWIDTGSKRVEHYRVWRGRTGKYVLHVERAAEYWIADADGKPVPAGAAVGPRRRPLRQRPEGIDARRLCDPRRAPRQGLAPAPELFEMVARSARQPTVEELDIYGALPRAAPQEAPDDRHDRARDATTPAATRAAPAVQVRGLRKAYGKQVVLDGIDLDVPEGTVFALLGPNGAGKTTAVHILTTLHLGRRRRGPRRRLRRRHGAQRRPRADRPHRPGLRGRRPVHRRGEPAPDGGPLPPAEGRGPAPASRSCWSGSTSSTPRASPR